MDKESYFSPVGADPVRDYATLFGALGGANKNKVKTSGRTACEYFWARFCDKMLDRGETFRKGPEECYGLYEITVGAMTA
jgi:hypothetical protein